PPPPNCRRKIAISQDAEQKVSPAQQIGCLPAAAVVGGRRRASRRGCSAVAEPNVAAIAEADDLPRTLRREREARERAKREEETHKRNATLTHDYDANQRSLAAEGPARAQLAAAGIVTGFDVPFFHLMRF